MSWQSYVDTQLLATTYVKEAVICGHDGNIWATSPGMNANATELKTVSDNVGKSDTLAMSGVTVGGIRYMYLSGTENVIRAKKGTGGLHIMKTKQAVIVAKYEEPIRAEQCATVTEALGDYLITAGY